MVSFFKNFGKGVLYVLVLPFLLVGMAVYGVVAFFVFLFLAVKGLILFFTGRSLYEDLPEDIEAKKRLAGMNPQEEKTTTVTNEDISSALNGNTQESPAADTTDPFYVPEYLKPEQETEESVPEENTFEEVVQPEEVPQEEPAPVEEEPLFKPNFDDEPDVPEETENIQEEEIILEKTEQKSNILEIKDDEDEEESSGVNIDFD